MRERVQLKRLVDDGMLRTQRVMSELRAQGLDATSDASHAFGAMWLQTRRRTDGLRETVVGDLRRPWAALGTATQPVAAARAFAAEYVSAAVRLDAFGRRSGALDELVRAEVERQLSERGVPTHDDLRALERRLKSSASRQPRRRTDTATHDTEPDRKSTKRIQPAARATVSTTPL